MRFFHPSAKISIFSEKLPQRTIPHAKAGLHANCTQMATFQFIIYMLKYSKDGVSVLVIIDRRRAKKNQGRNRTQAHAKVFSNRS